MYPKLINYFLIMTPLLMITTIAPAADEDNATQRLNVTVLIFSGRPNPTYTLLEDSALALAELLENAEVNQGPYGTTTVPSALGYNGIIVDNPSQLGGLPKRFFVHEENIELEAPAVLPDGSKEHLLTDQEKGIETFLLDKALENDAINEEMRNFIETGTY